MSNETSSLETERFEELPLCSCRMEAPTIERLSQQAGNQCMATESADGEVRGLRRKEGADSVGGGVVSRTETLLNWFD